MKKFCTSLIENAKNIIGFQKKKMLLLTSEELKSLKMILEYESVKDDLIKYEWLSCNKDYWDKLGEELKIHEHI